MHRIGIIPFDIKDEAIALLFVTSQTRGRWILPKGVAKKGETHAETGAREGFEEAGVHGKLLENFPITTVITKTAAQQHSAVPVTYYPFFVSEQKEEWPESNIRQRHWALLKDAARVVHREDFLNLIKQYRNPRPLDKRGCDSWIKEAVAT